MAIRTPKSYKTNSKKIHSKYFGVSYNYHVSKFTANLHRVFLGNFELEREAARAIDIQLIKLGLKPRNILKSKIDIK